VRVRSIRVSNKRRKGRGSPKRRGIGFGAKAAGLAAVSVIALAVIYFASNQGSNAQSAGGSGRYPYVVGEPSQGSKAPPIVLPSTDGGTFDLESLRGQTVLLYFQEGVMCQPCWDQLKDIERRWDEFEALGIDEVLSITTDRLSLLQQKVGYEGLTTPLLSDPDVAVSSAYNTNRYGMMGMGYNGHSFIVVGPDGTISWRADYGGPPRYTMYLPVSDLLNGMRRGLADVRGNGEG
jgi:peroxiredoxin